jgi:chromosome partitioning protein
MHERVIYAETFAHGRTALETEPKSVAAQEVESLGSEVKRKMESENS